MSLLIAFIFFSLVMFCVGMRRGWFRLEGLLSLWIAVTLVVTALGFAFIITREEKVELPHSIVEIDGVPYCVVPSLEKGLEKNVVKISSPNVKISFIRGYNIFGLAISTILVEE